MVFDTTFVCKVADPDSGVEIFLEEERATELRGLILYHIIYHLYHIM